MDKFVNNYIHAKYSSQGATIRVAMSTIASVMFMFSSRALHLSEREWRLWRNFSWAVLVSLVMLAITPSSTAVDRLSLYIIPLQVAILGRASVIFQPRSFGALAVTSYCFLVEFVWLNFAQFADAWVPYRFVPF